ncbi:MAG TPA: hypothetical protein VJS69_00065 [Candidatus Krumholzibacteria bacterium]|nr:hypothetical protein [Candidatus Krumholzibacteria bacterium]
MRYLLALVCLLLPSVSLAQVNTLGVYTEDGPAALCSTADTPGPHTLYVMVRLGSGVTGASFRIEHSSGFTGTLLSSSSPWLNVTGDPSTGVTVMFDNTCQFDCPVMTLNYMFVGGSPDCSWIRTAKNPQLPGGGPAISDCAFQWRIAYWEGTHVTSGDSTDCRNDINYEEHTHFCRPYWEPTVATEASTWGAVKALYR